MTTPANAVYWRPMTITDVPAVLALADLVHPGLPEEAAVFANRIALYPAGCLVLESGGGIAGYALSHPIRRESPPPLNTVLAEIDPRADAYYLHDVVVAPERRGQGDAATAIAELLAVAAAFPVTTLISVYGTGPFWGRFGFVAVDQKPMQDKLRPYGEGAIYMQRGNMTSENAADGATQARDSRK